MSLAGLTSRDAVLAAIAECDRLGQQHFLASHGYRPAREYVLEHAGRAYDSKAIAGVAYGYQHPAEGPLRAADFSGGQATVRRVLAAMGFTVERRIGTTTVDPAIVDGERGRRAQLWDTLLRLGDPEDVTPVEIAAAGIRPARTGQAIFRDHSVTSRVAPPHGVTLTLIDLGDSYVGEFDDAGGIYHYPATNRAGGERDEGEIEATKNAKRLGLPVFVVLAGRAEARRTVKLARVMDYDDEARQFLVQFEGASTSRGMPATVDAAAGSREELASIDEDEPPFEPFTHRPVKLTKARARPGQARFRFETCKRYGGRCAVCRVQEQGLLEAVHIVPFEAGGADDPRNGLVLCRNHHRAFDAHLLGFEPDTLAVRTSGDGQHAALLLERTDLKHLAAPPAAAAIRWRWDEYCRRCGA
jgi:putative restriction endonuclease